MRSTNTTMTPPTLDLFLDALLPGHMPPEIVVQIFAAHTQMIDTVCLPTVAIVTEPKIVVPNTARVFWTPWVFEEGKVVHVGLASSRRSDAVILIEVWTDQGDPGRIGFKQIGWRFVRQSEYVKAVVASKGVQTGRWSDIVNFIGKRPGDV